MTSLYRRVPRVRCDGPPRGERPTVPRRSPWVEASVNPSYASDLNGAQESGSGTCGTGRRDSCTIRCGFASTLGEPSSPSSNLRLATARRPSEPRADRSALELRHVASRRNAGSAPPLASGHCRRGAAHRYAGTVREARSDARAISAAVRRCASRLLRRGVGFIKPRRPRLPRVFARRERSRLHSGLVQTGTSRRDRGRGGPDRASPRGRRASVEDRSSPKGGSGCRAARVGLTSERPRGIGLQPQPSSTRGRRSQ